MTADLSQFLETVGASLSQDGQIAELQFKRKNGQVAHIQFPAAAAASIVLNIEGALGTIFEKQRAMLKGEDPRTFFGLGAKQVASIQGAVAKGVPVVSFVLKSNLRLDFALDRKLIRELIVWLQELETSLDKPAAARN